MINSVLDHSEIVKLRMWPAITGALRAPIMYLTLRVLSISSQWSLVVGIFVAMDQALIVESRFALIDAYLSMFASVTMLITAIIGRHPRRKVLVAVIAGIAAGATVSVKFTGGGVALALVFSLFLYFPLFDAIKLSFIAGISGVLVLLTSFLAHFWMLDKPGPGCKYHRRQWCRDLADGKTNAFVDTKMLIKQMLQSNFAINVTHSYSSKWWQWPVMLGKGTYMWVDGDRQLWCIGSPVVWLSGTIGVILWLIVVIFKHKIRQTLWVFVGYILSYLPFAMISRVMWNYHYFIPLLYSLIAGAVAVDALIPKAVVLPSLLILGEFVCFAVWFPITYATPMEWAKLSKLMLDAWKY